MWMVKTFTSWRMQTWLAYSGSKFLHCRICHTGQWSDAMWDIRWKIMTFRWTCFQSTVVMEVFKLLCFKRKYTPHWSLLMTLGYLALEFIKCRFYLLKIRSLYLLRISDSERDKLHALVASFGGSPIGVSECTTSTARFSSFRPMQFCEILRNSYQKY